MRCGAGIRYRPCTGRHGRRRPSEAICIMEYTSTSTVTVNGHESALRETFDVRHLERLPLGLSYVEQAGYIDQLLRRPPLAEGCDFSVDATGVGLAVADLFDYVSFMPNRILITGGNRQSRAGPRIWHVPKSILISTLDAKLHSGELRFAKALRDAPAMRDELRNFRSSVSNAGNFSFEARNGASDDLVLAVAMATWGFARRKAPPAVIARATFIRDDNPPRSEP